MQQEKTNPRMEQEQSDAFLVRRTLDGSDDAYAAIVRRYRNRIYNFTYRYFNNAAEAEDVTQEVFLTAYRNLHRFRGEAKFSTWLYQIAKNTSINKIRSLKRRMKYMWQGFATDDDGDQVDPISLVASDERGPDEVAEGREAQRAVQDAISRLNPVYRAALILRDIEDMSYEEISEILGLAEGTVKSRIHRARAELQKLLSGYMEQGYLP